MDSVSEVLRKHYADLYKILVKTDISRSTVTNTLYSEGAITRDERDKIKENERLHGAAQATDEILARIETLLHVYPSKVGIVLDALGEEEVLRPVVASMREKLGLAVPRHQLVSSSSRGQGASNVSHHVSTEQGRSSFDATELARILACQLRGQCAKLNGFLKKQTLENFALKLFEEGVITIELRDNPVYNQIEREFTTLLEFLGTKEEFETECKKFLGALRGVGGIGEGAAKNLKEDWIKSAIDEMGITLNL